MSHGIDLTQSASVAEREDLGRTVHLKDDRDEPAYEGDTPVTVTIAGSYSKRYRRTQETLTQRMFKRRQTQLTAEQFMANRVELVAACVLTWEGIRNGDKPLPCSRENATLLLNAAPWILAQLEDAQADHASFSPGSSTT